MLGVTDSVADYRIPEGDRMAAHRKSDRRRDGLRKRAMEYASIGLALCKLRTSPASAFHTP